MYEKEVERFFFLYVSNFVSTVVLPGWGPSMRSIVSDLGVKNERSGSIIPFIAVLSFFSYTEKVAMQTLLNIVIIFYIIFIRLH